MQLQTKVTTSFAQIRAMEYESLLVQVLVLVLRWAQGLPGIWSAREAKSFTRKRMTFVNTTAVAYRQRIGRSLMILVVCNSSCVHKVHAFASRIIGKDPGKKQELPVDLCESV